MASPSFIFSVSCLSSALLILCFFPNSMAAGEDKKAYIVYMGALPAKRDYSSLYHHHSILQRVQGNNYVGDTLIRSFGRSFNGFVARLTEAESEKIAGMEGVVSVFPETHLVLHTTRSWDFMGFNENYIEKNPEIKSDVIIGVIDSGIWPESQSFTDEGFGPPPKKWKGVCNGGSNFTCNNKVVGARCYIDESSSTSDATARDLVGHGTHTASTAAGNKVKDVSFYGLAEGIARGGLPSARIAAYKVCGQDGCSGGGILAAFDDAIADGVDVITISLGPVSSVPFQIDPTAIGAFHAMEKGILTVNSAGNSGPDHATLSSVSPWLLTVAASSTDRLFIDKVILGDGRTLVGRSINAFELNGTKFPLAFGKTASSSCGEQDARSCLIDCIDSKLVKGKILVCDRVGGISTAKEVGAIGAIVSALDFIDSPSVTPLPASVLTTADFKSLLSYINSTRNPEATILKSETVKDTTAPVVVSFSSRGPNTIVGDILKPDVTAPGVAILAAIPPVLSPSTSSLDQRRVNYSFKSGTSMSCPHAPATAAYVKSIHPNWSPSMIKSAVMTTAWVMNDTSNKDSEFAYGSGHINPTKAADPGLVYEATKDDYIKMLCAMNYTKEIIRAISGDNSTCPESSDKTTVRDLNYPSMAAKVSSDEDFEITFSRTVMNVGSENSTYSAKVTTYPELDIKVVPDVLSFNSLGQKKSFTVTISGKHVASGNLTSSSLVWSDGSRIVRSPIVIYA